MAAHGSDPHLPPPYRHPNDGGPGFFFEFPGLGHGVIDAADCPQDIALDFLYDPTAEPDPDRIAELKPPRFVIVT